MGIQLASLEKRLTAFYEGEGISVCPSFEQFGCKSKSSCIQEVRSSERNADTSLYCGSEAYVGSKYGDPFKVLFVSLDRGDQGLNIAERRKEIEAVIYDPPKPRLDLYLSGALETLGAILGRTSPDRNLFLNFALINAAKCASTKEGMDSVPEQLFRNCIPNALGELRVLEPDVVVMHGKRSRIPLQNYLQQIAPADVKHLEEVHGTSGASKEIQALFATILNEHMGSATIYDKSMICLMTPHPSSRSGEWRRFQRLLLTLAGRLCRDLVSFRGDKARK